MESHETNTAGDLSREKLVLGRNSHSIMSTIILLKADLRQDINGGFEFSRCLTLMEHFLEGKVNVQMYLRVEMFHSNTSAK